MEKDVVKLVFKVDGMRKKGLFSFGEKAKI
jgi:hypothetical protein